MKSKLITIALLLMLQNLKAQTIGPVLFSPNFGNTTPNTIGIGIGTWPFLGTTNARFHINNFKCNQQNGTLNGLLFRSDGNSAVDNNWQLYTGVTDATTSEKFKLFIPANSSSVTLQASDNLPFETMRFNVGATQSRMKIFNNTGSPSTPNGGGVGIDGNPGNPINDPGSLLHIGSSIVPAAGGLASLTGTFGWRKWMAVGTFNHANSDHMYVGLKCEDCNPINPNSFPEDAKPPGSGGPDRLDAVIAWGDNATNAFAAGPDYLRFINTISYNAGSPVASGPHVDGLEMMRIAPNTNVGIGNFYNNPLFTIKDPSNRLEILSDKAVANANGTPQLRLTNFQQLPTSLTTTGKFTDFHTTQLGDLGILASDNTQVNTAQKILKQRFVGINTINPNNTLEVNSQYVSAVTANGQPASTFGTPTGWAGLRFTDLNSSSIVQANPNVTSNGVLSVDANGDVIYVPGGGISTANNGLIVNGGNVQLGGNCTIPSQVAAAQLLTDRKIPLNANNLIFTSFPSPGKGGVGFGDFNNAQCAPGNLVEIRNNQSFSSATSGLRLSDLAGAVPLVSNNQVLSVNPANGDVILTTAPTAGTTLGGVCGTNTNPLTTNYEIPLANNNFLFGGQGTIGNNVGIGTTCAPIAKLDILQSSGNLSSTGLLVTNTDNAASISNPLVGIKSLVTGTGCIKVAGWFEATSSSSCFGSIFQNAIYVPQNGGFVTIGYPTPATGSSMLDVVGSVSSGGMVLTSDITLKNSVSTISNNALQKIKSLHPVTFKWNTTTDSSMNGIHSGFIAQEVDTVLPHLVKTNPTTNKKSVAYTEIIPYLVKGMQLQQRQIEKQDSVITVMGAQITALTSSVSSCCSSSNIRTTGVSGNNPNQLNINLSDADVIVLNQNVPNPFAEQTTITYNVPAKYGFAQMVFKTLDGKIIRTVDITTKGKGQLNVYANDLSNGLYMYSLIVDGKLIDSKKMVKE